MRLDPIDFRFLVFVLVRQVAKIEIFKHQIALFSTVMNVSHFYSTWFFPFFQSKFMIFIRSSPDAKKLLTLIGMFPERDCLLLRKFIVDLAILTCSHSWACEDKHFNDDTNEIYLTILLRAIC